MTNLLEDNKRHVLNRIKTVHGFEKKLKTDIKMAKREHDRLHLGGAAVSAAFFTIGGPVAWAAGAVGIVSTVIAMEVQEKNAKENISHSERQLEDAERAVLSEMKRGIETKVKLRNTQENIFEEVLFAGVKLSRFIYFLFH